MSFIHLITELFPTPITWPAVFLAFLVIALTLGGVTGRILIWLESVSFRSQ